MDKYQDILYKAKEHIGIITINRPKAMNAMTYQMRDELLVCFNYIKNDPEIRVVVITGEGDKAFMAGADIGDLEKETPLLERKNIMMQAHRLFRTIETLGKPVIAAINGLALGGGCELAMACTMRIAADNARFGLPEIKLGMIPGYGGTQRLPRIVGAGCAFAMMLSGSMINADEAYRIGLVNSVVKSDELISNTLNMANEISKMPPMAVKFILEAVDRGMNMPLDQALELEADMIVKVFSTEDAHEGLRAFIEKREPLFKGR